jgi:CDP-paratose 2-epimerase
MNPRFPEDNQPVLITGGAGFIGSNVASRLLQEGSHIIVYDNFSRPGVERNLRWLLERYSRQIRLIEADVQDEERLYAAVAACSRVFHFAAQVAVTTSLDDPVSDFSTNARGTLNLLEAIRKSGREIPLLFTSTNKVYGDLSDLDLVLKEGRYVPTDTAAAEHGIAEDRTIDFHSPYGCSKGAADQYVLDYARTFGMQTVVFRMSCIYGPHQFGTEDQGWIAHFLLQALRDEAIRLYGDGRQVRDVLFIDDLVEAMLLAHSKMKLIRGNAYNIGGGPDQTISLLELTEMIGEIQCKPVKVVLSDWRLADQRYYVSDTSRFMEDTGWRPTVSVRQGVERLHRWLSEESIETPSIEVIRGGSKVAST